MNVYKILQSLKIHCHKQGCLECVFSITEMINSSRIATGCAIQNPAEWKLHRLSEDKVNRLWEKFEDEVF